MKIKTLGIPDKFIEHGTQKELHSICYYDKEAIIKTVHEIIKEAEFSQAV